MNELEKIVDDMESYLKENRDLYGIGYLELKLVLSSWRKQREALREIADKGGIPYWEPESIDCEYIAREALEDKCK